MEYRFEATVSFQHVRANRVVINQAANQLMNNLAPALVEATKSALVVLGAVATGQTKRSIRQSRVSARSLSSSTEGILHRQVIGNRALGAIIKGRKAGEPMPVRFVGMGKKGKIFSPYPDMIRWFNAMGIPKSMWFPILREISRRGIAPRNVPARAVQIAKPAIRAHSRAAGVQIARGLITYAP